MRIDEIKVGGMYYYGRRKMKVRIVGVFMNAYRAIDLSTGRSVYIGSARKLSRIDD